MSFEDVFSLSFTNSTIDSLPMLSDSPSGRSDIEDESMYEELLETQPLVVLDEDDSIFSVDEDYKYTSQPTMAFQRPQKVAVFNEDSFADAAQHNYRLWLANVH